MKKRIAILWFMAWLMLFSACNNEEKLTEADIQGTVDAAVAGTAVAQNVVNTAVAQTVSAQSTAATEIPAVEAPATWTVVPGEIVATPSPASTAVPPSTSTPLPTDTPVIPTHTPVPTNTPIPTDTPIPPTNPPPPPTQPPPPPTVPPNPVFGGDILPNGGFEDGWYNMWGVPELQLPNNWGFEWDEGPTGYGNQPWDKWFRPETRVLPYFQLPEHERSLFIRDGDHTIKIFKGNGPISFRIYQDIPLEAGTYKLTIRAFPDLVMDYNGGSKVWADDPYAGEIRIVAPGGGTAWLLPTFGIWNTIEHTFTLAESGTARLGIGIRARYGLVNNGWFFDNWDLQRVQGG